MDGDAPTNAPRGRELTETETRYMRGEAQPVTSSVLISNSKYLNNPFYRDAFAQAALRRHGHDLSPTYMIPAMVRAIAEVTDAAEYQRLIDAEKQVRPEFAVFMADKPSPKYRVEAMRHHAEGTLGAAIRAFMEESGMQLEFMYGDEIADDVLFIAKRQMAIHDVAHIVTGFGPNNVGEAALQMCHITAIANYFTPELAHYINQANMYSNATSYHRASLHYPRVLPTLLNGMQLGIAAGQGLERPLFMVDWDQYLDWTLDDIAADLGFSRGPGAAWDWTTAASTG